MVDVRKNKDGAKLEGNEALSEKQQTMEPDE